MLVYCGMVVGGTTTDIGIFICGIITGEGFGPAHGGTNLTGTRHVPDVPFVAEMLLTSG